MKRKGTLFVITAPSGAGKTTLIRKLMRSITDLEFSISYTTRKKRKGEKDRVDYRFVSVDTFKKMSDRKGFLEWAIVFGDYYGTPRKETERMLQKGKDVLLDIDVQGAAQIREKKPRAVSIFIVPPDYKTLKKRLLKRKSETKEGLAKRLKIAQKDIKQYRHFDYLVINDHLEDAAKFLKGIILAEQSRLNRKIRTIQDIVQTFKE